MAQPEQVLLEAEFNPKVRGYWTLAGCLPFLFTIFGIPLIPLWLLISYPMTGRMLSRMQCTLTTRSLKLKKGVFVRVEKTVPLDKITDLGLTQGPIMRAFDIESLGIETAGSTTPTGATLSMTGIQDGRAFRDAVLAQRDALTAQEAGPMNQSPRPTTPADSSSSSQTDTLLTEIRDSLRRIEQTMQQDK